MLINEINIKTGCQKTKYNNGGIEGERGKQGVMDVVWCGGGGGAISRYVESRIRKLGIVKKDKTAKKLRKPR